MKTCIELVHTTSPTSLAGHPHVRSLGQNKSHGQTFCQWGV